MPTPIRLLVVEDSRPDADRIVLWLRHAGYECEWTLVDTPARLAAALETAAFDLLITDYQMPAFNGLDALRQARAHDPDLPCVLLSGGVDEEVALDALRAGATDVLYKDRLRRLGPVVEGALARGAEHRERRRVERALLLSEARLAGVVGSAMDAIISIDAAHRVILFNQAAERMFGVAAADAVGGSLDRLVPGWFGDVHRGQVDDASQTGATSRLVGLGRLSGVRADRSEFLVEAAWSRAAIGDQPILTVILRDISARVAAEAALASSREAFRALSQRLQSLLEEERTRIAREVHDQLGQSLTAIKLEASRLQALAAAAGVAAPDEASSLLGLTDATIATVRRIASDLRPAILDLVGLGSAIDWQLREFSRRTGVAATFDGPLEDDVASEAATACFRIVQEALTNVARHAHARHVRVVLRTTPGEVAVDVLDDGDGLPPEAAAAPSLGLLGMRERAAALAGSVRIESRRPRGTQVLLRLPLASAPAS